MSADRSNSSSSNQPNANAGSDSSTEPDVIRILDRLLVVAQDGVEGYRHAASAIPGERDASIHSFLAKNAAEREEIVATLTNALVSYGYKPAHHGSLAGAAHRRWVDLIGKIGYDPAGILTECERGEEKTISAYAHALGRALPAEVHALVQAQLGRVLSGSAALSRILLDLRRHPIANSPSH
jgi:uncharacterized protein (TIGR02284 family)